MGTFTPLIQKYSMKTIINKKTKVVQMKKTQVINKIFNRLDKTISELEEKDLEIDLFIEEDISDDDKFKKLLSERSWLFGKKSTLEMLLKYDLEEFDNKYFDKK